MTSSRPYLIRALYDWINDNQMTPHLLVDANTSGVRVPPEHVHDGRIVLNINSSAVQNLELGNEWIFFGARFGGVSHELEIPVAAVLAIYARESGQSMVFGREPGGDEIDPTDPDAETNADSQAQTGKSNRPRKKPTLKVVK